jgi:hypothetical protein
MWIDSTPWSTFKSDRYFFSIGHPSQWTVLAADHKWTIPGDADNPLSTGQEAFLSPSGDVRVGAWAVSLDEMTEEAGADVEDCCVQYCQQINSPSCGATMWQWGDSVEWVVRYCQQTNADSCTGLVDRAVPLCIERWDCHPAVLVPFENDVRAFMRGGIIGPMVVVAVWHGESDPTVEPYGGARQLLEAFLYTMEVCPARLDQGPQEPWGCPLAP